MLALANQNISDGNFERQPFQFEGNLRANGQSKIEKTLQVPEIQELIGTLSNITERAGFEPAVRRKANTGFRNRLHQPLGHLSDKTISTFQLYSIVFRTLEKAAS